MLPTWITPYEGSSDEERIWFATKECAIKGLHDAHANAKLSPSFFSPSEFASTKEVEKPTQMPAKPLN